MVARDVDRAATELRAFRSEVWQHFGLAALAFGCALAASRLYPALAVPLLFGGIASLFLGVRAAARRWELIDSLGLERDAYRIREVRERAEQAATMKSRHALASSIHALLSQPGPTVGDRVSAVAADLDALAAELDDDELELDPASAVACVRLLGDAPESALRNPTVPTEDVRARISQIHAGFRPRQAPGGRG